MKKTAIDYALRRYFEAFGEQYPFLVVDLRSETEITEDIEDCIKKGKKATSPHLMEGAVY